MVAQVELEDRGHNILRDFLTRVRVRVQNMHPLKQLLYPRVSLWQVSASTSVIDRPAKLSDPPPTVFSR